MSDNFENEDNQEESFAELFEQYSAGINQDINQGDRIEGEIISIGASTVYVDTGTKSDGVVDKSELLDEHGECPYKVGDKIGLYVVSVTESEVILSKALSGSGEDHVLKEAHASRTPVEGKVKEVIKGGFHIDISGKRAFCPISQIDAAYVDKPEDYVGETFHFFITRYEERGRNIVVSRRDYLNVDIQKKKDEFFETLEEGMTCEARITKLMPFGAFAELIQGVEGMIHISELSWSRVEKAEEVVRPGDQVMVKVLSIKATEEGKNPKIGLSIKQISADPWELAGSRFHAGDQLTGKVVRCAPFGAFVELAPGTEGLVHVSEMSYTKRILKPEDEVSVGDVVQVVVKDVDTLKKRISLSMKDAHGDPWSGITLKYPVGRPAKGTVERREPFGIFINLEPGVTGLLPKSKISQSGETSDIDKLKTGDTITLCVESVDEEKRRISLDLVKNDTQEDWKTFAPSDRKNLGTMGELLQQAMKKKKD
jgi:small subunit ribosomal protein S1